MAARLDLPQREAGVKVFHVRQVDQHLARQLREAVEVLAHHLELERARAADVVARDDLGDLADRLLHLTRALAGIAIGIEPHEREHAQADPVAVDLGVVALDVAGLLEGAHAAPARRGRQAHALRQFGIRQARVGLQLGKDLDVEFVERFHFGLNRERIFPMLAHLRHQTQRLIWSCGIHCAAHAGDRTRMNAPLPEHIRKALETVTLDDKYALDGGRAFMSGVQALVKLPMLQRQRDALQGKNTAGFISGYRGSPLGGYDQALWKANKYLQAQDIVFQPGVNEELAATAIWGTQQLGFAPPGTNRYDGVF